MEDYFATTRNGHQLVDYYDPVTKTLDIHSNGLYPSNVLSNLCGNEFRFDGMVCGSMEFFPVSKVERHRQATADMLHERSQSMEERCLVMVFF